jgi:hypothetical protein
VNCPAPSHEFGMFFTSSAAGASFARRILVRRLRAWGYETDPAALLIGELAANAATHCPATRLFRMRIAVRGAVLRIEATDDCGQLAPELVKPNDEAESGRGLLLVDALSSAWGVEPSHGGGKTVWCEYPVRCR